MTHWTHLDDKGRVRMVDVGDKPATDRTALAEGTVRMSAETFAAIEGRQVAKGNVLETARIAGVMAAKRTAELIPMCHPLRLSHVQVDFFADRRRHRFRIEARVRTTDRTGVEMEALTAVAAAALTVYDMCKALDKSMTITDIRLLEKTGGKSGTYRRGGER